MITILVKIAGIISKIFCLTLFVALTIGSFMLRLLSSRLVSIIRGRGDVAHCADADRHAQDHIPGGRERERETKHPKP